MARTKLPYYCLYPFDFDADEIVRGMDDCEIGFFLRCLNHAWMNNGLPSDPAEIERCIPGRRTPEEFQRIWLRVSRCFIATSDGRLINIRQEEERDSAREKSEVARESIAKRWKKTDTNVSNSYEGGNTNVSEKKYERNTHQNQNQNQRETPLPPLPESPPLNLELVDWFRSIWLGEFPENTWQVLAATVNTPERLAAFRANIPLWMKTRKYRDGAFCTAVKFLRDGSWLKPPPAVLLEEPKGMGKIDPFEELLRREREKGKAS